MTTNSDTVESTEPEPQYPVHPDDLARWERPTKDFYISCQSHCCKKDGCKYNFKGCPVKTGQVVQDYPCEQCTWPIEDALRWADRNRFAQPGEIGHSVVFGLKRDNTDGRGQMADMPTDAQVNRAVTDALAGLTINGWSLTRVLGATEDPDDENEDED